MRRPRSQVTEAHRRLVSVGQARLVDPALVPDAEALEALDRYVHAVSLAAAIRYETRRRRAPAEVN